MRTPPSGGPASGGASNTSDPFGILGTAVADTFQIEKVVAHGGFAVVYRAKHLRFAAPVALKCLKIPAALSATERADFLERFQKEGEVMFRLSSTIPEVVRPLQFDSFRLATGRLVPFIALEWLEGETLKDIIVNRLTEGKEPIPPEQAVTFLTPVARALARAHRLPTPEGVVLCILHCDLKPDNIFVANLDAGGQTLRIFDFGISKVRSVATRQAGGSTGENQTSMFTPAYAAPEQWAPEKYGQVGAWTDVFSLALTLTELITQKPAIDGVPTAMLAQCINDKSRPTPRRLGLNVSNEVESVFLKALAVDPKQRFQGVPQFWGALEQALGLPPVLGENRPLSVSGMPAAVPQPWNDDPAQRGTHAEPGSNASFGGELDLPPSPGHAAPQANAAPSSFGAGAHVLAPMDPSSLSALELAGPSNPSSAPAPFMDPSAPSHPALSPEAQAAQAQEYGGSLDLADAPVSSQRSVDPRASGQGVGQPPPSQRSFDPRASGQGVGPPMSPPPVYTHDPFAAEPYGQHGAPGSAPKAQPVMTKERLQAAASKAGQVASGAAVSAAHAAKSIATKALEVDARHEIRLDEPATWIKPMMGPIIAMAAAVAISILVVIINKVTNSSIRAVWISLPLMVASIGFAVYRWLKLTQR